MIFGREFLFSLRGNNMKNFSRLLCLLVLLGAGSIYSEVFAGRVVLANDATIATSEQNAIKPISISNPFSQLTFTADNATYLSFAVNGQASFLSSFFVNLSQLDLKIYNPETGDILTVLTLKPESMSRFNLIRNIQRTVVFTLSDFNGVLPQNQELALAIVARMSCSCSAFGSIDVALTTPEPATMLLLPSGLAALGWVLRRRKRH